MIKKIKTKIYDINTPSIDMDNSNNETLSNLKSQNLSVLDVKISAIDKKIVYTFICTKNHLSGLTAAELDLI